MLVCDTTELENDSVLNIIAEHTPRVVARILARSFAHAHNANHAHIACRPGAYKGRGLYLLVQQKYRPLGS